MKLTTEDPWSLKKFYDDQPGIRFYKGAYQMAVRWRASKAGEGDQFEAYEGRVDLVNSTMLRLAAPKLFTLVQGPPARLRPARRADDVAAEQEAEALRVWELPPQFKALALSHC